MHYAFTPQRQPLVNQDAHTGASEILGLEVAGVISEVGKGVTKFKKGDRVMALLDGGGYAEYALAPEGFVMPLPDNLSFAQGAGIPEVGCCPVALPCCPAFLITTIIDMRSSWVLCPSWTRTGTTSAYRQFCQKSALSSCCCIGWGQ